MQLFRFFYWLELSIFSKDFGIFNISKKKPTLYCDILIKGKCEMNIEDAAKEKMWLR